jgi:hypothetical protein
VSRPGLTIAFIFFRLLCLSQQPTIVVQSFEYVWPRYATGATGRVNIASDEGVQQALERSFKNAIQTKWNVELPDLNVTLKSLPLFAKTPKFNTKLKSKQPGTWYLFLQVIDDPYTNYVNSEGSFATRLEAKCKVVDYKDSIVFERQLFMIMNIEKTPPTEVRLVKLIAHPQHVAKTFEIMARWLFGPEDVTQKEVWLNPACIYTEKQLPSQPISSLQYKASQSTLCVIPGSICLSSSPMVNTKRGSNKNIAGNTAGSVLTALTGIGTSKVKTNRFDADFSFRTDDSIVYHCKIPYLETISAERERDVTKNSDGSKSYSTTTGPDQLSGRRPDSLSESLVMRGDDTIARFIIKYIKAPGNFTSYTKMWDGTDTTTIAPLKKEWANNKMADDVSVQIKTATDSIHMRTSVERTVKEFSINQQTVLVIYGADIPSTGVLLHPVSKSDLVLFTILASLPYSYFNYGD